MNRSQTFDPGLHDEGSTAAAGRCSFHSARAEPASSGPCSNEAIVSFQDQDGRWQAGCALALEQLVEQGEIEPLGQGG